MNPLPSLAVAVALISIGVGPLQAQATSSPVDAIAKKLAEDPKERADAAQRLEAFLLNPDSSGRTFVGAGADRAALAAVVREWTAKENAGRLAALVFLTSQNTAGEARLREALAAWTGPAQIRKDSEKSSGVAFLSDASEKASMVMADRGMRREIEASIAANDTAAPAVPGARASTERARLVRVRAGKGNVAVFGPDRAAQDLNGGEGRSGSVAGGVRSAGISSDSVRNLPHGVRGKIAPAVQLPQSQGRPDGIVVPAPGGGETASATSTSGGQGGAPNDGRVVPAKPMSAWERVKDSVKNPMSDAYGFTFEGPEPQPVSFRDHAPALAYIKKAKAGAFTKVTLYGHGAPGLMTVGSWSGDSGEIAFRFKGKMAPGPTLDLKGCNTSSIGGASVNPGRGLSGLTRRVLYFSIPYLSEGRDPGMREILEEGWDSDLARDTSRGMPGVKVCGLRTFGLVGDRVPLVGSLMGRREATNSDAVLGSKACFVDGKEVRP
jgi:hypothetical protein